MEVAQMSSVLQISLGRSPFTSLASKAPLLLSPLFASTSLCPFSTPQATLGKIITVRPEL